MTNIPALDDVVDMELSPEDDRNWIVLFDGDYDDYLVDADDSIALLVDIDQALELLRLANMAVAELAPEDAPQKEPLVAIVEALEQEVED